MAFPAYGGLGAVMAAGQAPLGWWWVTIAALAVLFCLLPLQATPRNWSWRLWAAGTGYFAASLFWIVEPFFIEPERHGWMAPFALVLMAGGMALFWAAAGWLAAWAGHGRGRLVALVAALVALELGRGWIFTGFPWAMLGHVLVGTPLMQLAAWGGAGALSLLVLVVALLPALGQTGLQRAGGLLAGLALVAGLWVWGGGESDLPPAQNHVIRLAQPNAPQAEKWQGDNPQRFFNRLLDQTAAPASPAPALIVWPETAVPFFLEHAGDGLAMMAEATHAHGPETLLGFGVQRYEDGRYFNSLAVLDITAQVTQIYDKHHLVPFGEYVPLSEFLLGSGMAGFAAQVLQGYSPGPGPALLDMGPLGHALPLICYESIFPRHLRGTDRPDWVLQITNDAWFGEMTGPFQHLAQARLRAVEQGLPVLRAANTGVSAVIDARGGIVAQLGLGETGFLDAPLPTALPATLYARVGDVPVWVALLAVLGAMVALRLRSGARPA
ncbi:apolipoprotein N-acyltransferase [Roseinatronobacter sp. HJB301]|uniref:Apolipoprotein N-acyltransferase n=1 Tax=Roseinatronobacter alkalisoli TaxID=3028235 RepID=A0ABT5T4V3_9RHOB|nr:apolipoprotein N-acyltransferase [Roseinatronobacter sp. HJB301]MDD7970024.1 apolipoprotein N-acyltransferase [Roseinatronobacter sp. HJB301]